MWLPVPLSLPANDQVRDLPLKGATYATLITACVRAKQHLDTYRKQSREASCLVLTEGRNAAELRWRWALWLLHEMERTGADKSEKNKAGFKAPVPAFGHD